MITNTNGTNYRHDLHVDSGIRSRRVHTLVTSRAPRRMYLCDVPLFFERDCSSNIVDDDMNFVRLMGTIVEIIQPPPPNPDPNPMTGLPSPPLQYNKYTITAHYNQIIQFVIDDGTGVLNVVSGEREAAETATNSDNRTDTSSAEKQIYQNASLQTSDIDQPPSPLATLPMIESLLTSSQYTLSVGQTVDCIGRLQSLDYEVDEGCSSSAMFGEFDTSHIDHRRIAGRILLVASSVSLVTNPQAVTLRQLELSSSRLGDSGRPTNSNNDNHNNNSNNNKNNHHHHHQIPIPPPPKNRILIGGHLERKLNPLYHCNQQGSVYLNLEDAFHYIKHSKDDGGITSMELASLVGALESNEVLAVNLAVERLREDCRIYLNQGKWFPI